MKIRQLIPAARARGWERERGEGEGGEDVWRTGVLGIIGVMLSGRGPVGVERRLGGPLSIRDDWNESTRLDWNEEREDSHSGGKSVMLAEIGKRQAVESPAASLMLRVSANMRERCIMALSRPS